MLGWIATIITYRPQTASATSATASATVGAPYVPPQKTAISFFSLHDSATAMLSIHGRCQICYSRVLQHAHLHLPRDLAAPKLLRHGRKVLSKKWSIAEDRGVRISQSTSVNLITNSQVPRSQICSNKHQHSANHLWNSSVTRAQVQIAFCSRRIW